MQPRSEVALASKKSFRFLPEKVAYWVLDRVDDFSKGLVRRRTNPNLLTLAGLFFGGLAGLAFAAQKPGLAAIAIFICGFFDILDGKVAANLNRRSLFGAIFDSSLDRYSEFFVYLGLAYYFRHHWALWLIFFTLLGSFMVSYTRARAEGLGLHGSAGIMQRAERMVLLFTGALVGAIFSHLDIAMITVLIIITLGSHITAWQRIFLVRQQERAKSQVKEV